MLSKTKFNKLFPNLDQSQYPSDQIPTLLSDYVAKNKNLPLSYDELWDEPVITIDGAVDSTLAVRGDYCYSKKCFVYQGVSITYAPRNVMFTEYCTSIDEAIEQLSGLIASDGGSSEEDIYE